MSSDKLAIFGGARTIRNELQKYNPIGVEEVEAAKQVAESGMLSGFVACSGDEFYGGPKVREFESRCQKYFGVEFAVTVNSWTWD